MSGGTCRWTVKRPGKVCIGPARYETLYCVEYVPPQKKDYHLPKTGGGWHRSASRQVYNPVPYKTDKSLYSIEFGRVKVPGQSDFQPLQRRVVPFLPQYPKPTEKQKDRCGRDVEDGDGDGLQDEFQDKFNVRGKCCHTDHKRYVSKAENPLRYPFSLFDPQFVDHDRPLTPPVKIVKPYPKRVTEDDVRNNLPPGWQGTKGFFTPGASGVSSESGLAASDRYFALVRPLEGTLLAMNANRSIKSMVME